MTSFISDLWQQDDGARAVCLGEGRHSGAGSERESGAHGCVGEQREIVAQALVCVDVTPVGMQVPQPNAGNGRTRFLQGARAAEVTNGRPSTNFV